MTGKCTQDPESHRDAVISFGRDRSPEAGIRTPVDVKTVRVLLHPDSDPAQVLGHDRDPVGFLDAQLGCVPDPRDPLCPRGHGSEQGEFVNQGGNLGPPDVGGHQPRGDGLDGSGGLRCRRALPRRVQRNAEARAHPFKNRERTDSGGIEPDMDQPKPGARSPEDGEDGQKRGRRRISGHLEVQGREGTGPSRKHHPPPSPRGGPLLERDPHGGQHPLGVITRPERLNDLNPIPRQEPSQKEGALDLGRRDGEPELSGLEGPLRLHFDRKPVGIPALEEAGPQVGQRPRHPPHRAAPE